MTQKEKILAQLNEKKEILAKSDEIKEEIKDDSQLSKEKPTIIVNDVLQSVESYKESTLRVELFLFNAIRNSRD